jgi:hypothetical protein
MTAAEKVIKTKVSLLDWESSSAICLNMPSDWLHPRQFLSVQRLYETGGKPALQESRSKPNLRNRIGEEIEKPVVELAMVKPA